MLKDDEAPHRRLGNARWPALAALALLCAVGFALNRRADLFGPRAASAEADRPPAERLDAPVVAVEAVAPAVLNEPIRVTGNLRTDEMVTLSTKASGVVLSVHAREGDRVTRGQLLVVIDDADLRAQRERAAGAVRAAEAQVVEARAVVQSAEARLKQAQTNRVIKDTSVRMDHRRAEQAVIAARLRLSQARSLSEIADTESETRVQSGKAALQAARERLKVLAEGARRQETAVAQAAVRRAEAQVQRMRSHLARREQLLREKAVAAEVVDNARRDLEAAESEVEAARQQLSLVLEGPRTEEIRAQEELVRQAEAALREAEANRARRGIGKDEVEAAQASLAQAEAAEESARANLAQSDWNEDEVRSATAALAVARAAVGRAEAGESQARADMRYQEELIRQTRIYSPVNGVVTRRNVQAGAAVVQMRNELMTLVSSDTLFFEATAPEAVASQLRPGLPARVLLDAFPGEVFPGTVRQVIPVAEGSSRAVRLRISIPRALHAGAVVGGFARAEIRGASASGVLSVPRAALVTRDGEFGVYVFSRGRAVRRPVEIGDPGGTGSRVPVRAGLRPGDRVIVSGAADLSDGQAVSLRPAG